MLEAGKMGKYKDLSDSDRGPTVMTRRLDQSISKTAGLVGCYWSAVIGAYQTGVTGAQALLMFATGERRLARVVWSHGRAAVALIERGLLRMGLRRVLSMSRLVRGVLAQKEGSTY